MMSTMSTCPETVRRSGDAGPSKEHHLRTLARAARLRAAAEGPRSRRLAAAGAYLAHYDDEMVEHMRQEERAFYPLLMEERRRWAVSRALADHEHLHVLARRLSEAVRRGDAPPALLQETAALLVEHIDLEEVEVLPLLDVARRPAGR
jgi:iron-sulfur cluster repair protein YtfE (RIC family)